VQAPRSRRKVGLSRRELEWALEGMMRQLPGEPQALARHLGAVVVSLIEQNNAAIAAALPGPGEDESEGS
jgi:hypothetical protein